MKTQRKVISIAYLTITGGTNVAKLKRWVLTETLQEKGFKLYWYLNQDAVMVCALV